MESVETILVRLSHAYDLAVRFSYCPFPDENESAKKYKVGEYGGMTPEEIVRKIVEVILKQWG